VREEKAKIEKTGLLAIGLHFLFDGSLLECLKLKIAQHKAYKQCSLTSSLSTLILKGAEFLIAKHIRWQ
jgi:hypothetical protein